MSNKIQVLGGALELYQLEQGFKSGTDAVFLAAACPVKPGESVLDLGCGVGTAGLCVAARVSGVKITGIDIQDECVDLARQNAEVNDLPGSFLQGDIQDFKNERFDHVICNPPYGHHHAAIEKGETDLKEWINAALRNLKGRGTFTMVHRADRIDQILVAMGGRFGGLEIIPLWPKAGAPAKRFIVRGVKDSQSPSTIHPGIILHQENGDYTEAAEEILREAKALL